MSKYIFNSKPQNKFSSEATTNWNSSFKFVLSNCFYVCIESEDWKKVEKRGKMSLALLRKNAASKSNYIRFTDMQRGNYFVKKFSLCDNAFGDGKRIMVHLKNGYAILPERMMKSCNNEKAIKNLNTQKFVLVFKGKDKKPPR